MTVGNFLIGLILIRTASSHSTTSGQRLVSKSLRWSSFSSDKTSNRPKMSLATLQVVGKTCCTRMRSPLTVHCTRKLSKTQSLTYFKRLPPSLRARNGICLLTTLSKLSTRSRFQIFCKDWKTTNRLDSRNSKLRTFGIHLK